MERLEKLINILKLTPHRQPELVKEATHRALKILIQYCDEDDSAQRSLFNDHLNCTILAFQHQHYHLVLNVLVDEIVNNGTARRLSTALLRIPLLINNVQPIELGCDSHKLLKALIEITRRSEDESVQKSLEGTIESVMPFLDYQVRTNKEAQFLANSLMELLMRKLENESSVIRRIAASIIACICSTSETQTGNVIAKLKNQLDNLFQEDEIDSNRLVSICLCARKIEGFSGRYYSELLQLFIRKFLDDRSEAIVLVSALETLKELVEKFQIERSLLQNCARVVAEKFLLQRSETDENLFIKSDGKVIYQSNALACLTAMVKQQPSVSGSLESIISLFKSHQDAAIRNQTIILIGNYIDAYWRFPSCVNESIDCERIRKLWVELRSIIFDDSTPPDTHKSCVISIRTCIGTLLESDHCLHIVEYQDIDRMIHLYTRSNFTPLKIEILNLFSSLNYATIHYLEKQHWSKLRGQSAGSLLDSIQERMIDQVILPSLTDDHQRIRTAASNALITLIPNLFVAGSPSSIVKTSTSRPNDPIVSLASKLASDHMVVLEQTNVNMSLLSGSEESVLNLDTHDKFVIRDAHKLLTSSIIQPCNNPYNDSEHYISSQSRENISVNLARIVSSLKMTLENSLVKGKNTIASLVGTLYELSLAYPIHEYPSSWDCRQSEYCDSFILLNFLMTYLENLTEPDVIVDDLEAYRLFLAFIHQLLYALCHESVCCDYEAQKMRPHHKRAMSTRDGYWSELTIKHSGISDALQIYFTHLVKLLWLSSAVIEELNPFASASKTTSVGISPGSSQSRRSSQRSVQQHNPSSDSTGGSNSSIMAPHQTLTTNLILFNRIFRKLELSFKSSKKNLNQKSEKFYQILGTCLSSVSSLLEFIGMSKSVEYVKDILAHLKITATFRSTESLICARQLLKSLFGINIIAIYQVDPYDWFEEEASPSPGLGSSNHSSSFLPDISNNPALQGVYHYMITNPYKIFSSYQSKNCNQITPGSDKSLAILNYESRRALKVRRRIEDRVKNLFEINPSQILPPKTRQISESLKLLIADFSPIVTVCMNQFKAGGFCHYQTEALHFMSYLLLLRVNYHKLPMAMDTINSINKLLDDCGERMFLAREQGMEPFLRTSFTFLTLLTYERGPTKAIFSVAAVIQKFDDLRAKLSMASATERDLATYIVPLLRCLVEDLFIYRTEYFQTAVTSKRHEVMGVEDDRTTVSKSSDNLTTIDRAKKSQYEALEAERETVAQKLLDVIDNPGVYDLLSILILESRRNPSEIKYKKLSQHLLSIIPNLLSRRSMNLADYKRIELTRRIIENISPEVFQPINFIIETLLEAAKPPPPLSVDQQLLNQIGDRSQSNTGRSGFEFQRWMSLVLITIHILITQVKEEKFLSRIRELMSDQSFVEYLLHIAQLCAAEIVLELSSPVRHCIDSEIVFLTQQLSCYILYITHMFQSGLFYQLSRQAIELIKDQTKCKRRLPNSNFKELCAWARDANNGFSLKACEHIFYYLRFIYPDLTISWCNILSILNSVDCNQNFWRNLLVYKCHHCLIYQDYRQIQEGAAICSLALDNKETPRPKVGERDSLSLDLKPVNQTSINRENISPTKSETFKRSGGRGIDRPSSLNLTDIQISDQLRRSFMRRIATTGSRDTQTLNRNIVTEANNENGQLLEREVNMGNTEQCLSPNVELTRRGVLCMVLDYVTISMSDVESIIWLIIHHINDIIRWSHETPIADFINAVHGNSASSGIFIQAINTSFNNLTSISFVTRLLWTLENVHYTQYGSLVVLLVEKLLSSTELKPYLSLTRKIEEFACETVQKLLNDTNKSLITTNDEVVNQLTSDDLDRIISMLDCDLYPNLSQLLRQLRNSNPAHEQLVVSPSIELHRAIQDSSDEDADDEKKTTGSSKVATINNLVNEEMEMDYTKITHVSLLRDMTLLDSFCDRVIKLGWNYRRQFEEIWMILIGALSTTLSQNSVSVRSVDMTEPGFNDSAGDSDRRACLVTSCKVITTLTRLLDLCRRTVVGDPKSRELYPTQSFDDRVMSLTRTIASNLSGLKKKTASLFDIVELDKSQVRERVAGNSPSPPVLKSRSPEIKPRQRQANGHDSIHSVPNYSYFLRVHAQKLRLSSILNVELDLHDTVVIESDTSSAEASSGTIGSRKADEVDVESCIQLILSIYKQKLRDPNEDLLATSPADSQVGAAISPSDTTSMASSESDSLTTTKSSSNDIPIGPIPQPRLKGNKAQKQEQNQLPPPLSNAIVQSILSLSDMFKSYEQFMWMFEAFNGLMKIAERNEDEIQMQYLLQGLCPSTGASTSVHNEAMFERCRQLVERCVKSDFVPLKVSALHGAFYMLEDSIDIVASGAWELDDFKRLRQMRFTWIIRLMPIILDRDNGRYLSGKMRTMKLLEALCETVTETELRALKNS